MTEWTLFQGYLLQTGAGFRHRSNLRAQCAEADSMSIVLRTTLFAERMRLKHTSRCMSRASHASASVSDEAVTRLARIREGVYFVRFAISIG